MNLEYFQTKLWLKPSSFLSEGKRNTLVRRGEEIQALVQKCEEEIAHIYRYEVNEVNSESEDDSAVHMWRLTADGIAQLYECELLIRARTEINGVVRGTIAMDLCTALPLLLLLVEKTPVIFKRASEEKQSNLTKTLVSSFDFFLMRNKSIVSSKILEVLRKDDKLTAFKMWGAMLNLVPVVLERPIPCTWPAPLLTLWRQLRDIVWKASCMGNEDKGISKKLQEEMESMFSTLANTDISGALSQKLMETLIGQTEKKGKVKKKPKKQSKTLERYRMESNPRGLALVINNRNFKDDDEEWYGSQKYERALHYILQTLGFKSTERVVCNRNAPHLVGMPNWLIQACRGARCNLTIPVKGQASKSWLLKITWNSDSPMGDTCITYATIPGYMENLPTKMLFKKPFFVCQGKQNTLVRRAEEIQALVRKYGVEREHAYRLSQLLNTLRFNNNSGMTLQLKQDLSTCQGMVVALLNIGQTDLALDVWKWYISVVVFAMETGDRQAAVDMWKILVEQVPRLTMHGIKDISSLEWHQFADELRNADESGLNTAWWRELVDELLSMLSIGKNEIATECWKILKSYLSRILENNCLSFTSKLWNILVDPLTPLQETGQKTVALEWWKALVYCLTDVLELALFETASEWCVSLAGKLQTLMTCDQTNNVNDWWGTVFYCLVELRYSKKIQVAGNLWKLFVQQLSLLTHNSQTELASRWWEATVYCLMPILDKATYEISSEWWKILIEQMAGAVEKGLAQKVLSWWQYLSDQVLNHLKDQKRTHTMVWWRALVKQVTLALKEQINEATEWWSTLVRQAIDVLKNGQQDKATDCWSFLIETVIDELINDQGVVAVSCWLVLVRELGATPGDILKKTVDIWWTMLIKKLPKSGEDTAVHIWSLTADGIAKLHDYEVLIWAWTEMNGILRRTIAKDLDAALPLLLLLVEKTPVILKRVSEEKQSSLTEALFSSFDFFLMRNKKRSDFKAAQAPMKKLADMLQLAEPKDRKRIFETLLERNLLIQEDIDNASDGEQTLTLMYFKAVLNGMVDIVDKSEPDEVLSMWTHLVKVVSDCREQGSENMAFSMWENLLNRLADLMNMCPTNSTEMYETILDLVPDFLEQDHKEKILHYWDELLKLAADHPDPGNNVRGFWRIVSSKVLEVLRKDDKPTAFKMWGAMLNLVPVVLERSIPGTWPTPLLTLWWQLRDIVWKASLMGNEDKGISKKLQEEMEAMYSTLAMTDMPGALSQKLMETLNDQAEKKGKFNKKPKKQSKTLERYRMESSPRGLALVINNHHFEDNEEARYGSQKDERAFCSTLQTLGFAVEIKRDQCKDDMINSISEFAKREDHEGKDAAVLAVMTHGNEKGLQGIDGEFISTEEVILSFCNRKAPHLVGKPKWLLFQACRGVRSNFTMPGSGKDAAVSAVMPHGNEKTSMVIDGAPKSFLPKINRNSNSPMGDTCITYATIPGYIACRDERQGSWMVQFLCKEIRQHWRHWCLEDILTKVQGSVEEIKWSGPLGEETQIMEVSYRGWKKKLYFSDAEAEREEAESRWPASNEEPEERKSAVEEEPEEKKAKEKRVVEKKADEKKSNIWRWFVIVITLALCFYFTLILNG